MPCILVTGSSGQLGSELSNLSTSYPNFDFIFVNRTELDLIYKDNIDFFFSLHTFEYCINAGAYTKVDQAEKDSDLAYQVNSLGVENLAYACNQHNVKLIHLSTDYVYHNDLNRPLIESDPTTPRGVYARTKLTGERLARNANPQTLIIRTSWVYSHFGNNFVKTMVRLGQERDHLRVVFDQVGSPTYARDLANTLLEIIKQIEAGKTEVFSDAPILNYSNEGVTSWYDFAFEIFKLCDVSCQLTPIESKEYPTPAQRPTYSLMNKSLIKKTFNLKIPHWSASLKRCLEEELLNR